MKQLFAAITIILLAACGAQPGSVASPPPSATTASTPAVALTSSPVPSTPNSGQFVFASGDGTILLRDGATLQTKPILKTIGKEIYDTPSFSPDGSQIVFVAHILDASTPSNEIGVMNVDGTNVRALFKPAAHTKIFPTYPRYTPDGTAIYFSTVMIGASTQDQKFQVVRGAATGGDWKVIVDNGHQPALSKDGTRLTFTRPNLQTFTSSLWLANADGTNPQQLLADDVFVGVSGQRFSPDGKWITFAASGPPQKKLPSARLRPSAREPSDCAVGWWMVCFVSRAHANGLPWDIWLVSVDGKNFKQLTKLGLDSPWPAFSKDGRYVAFISTSGLFVYDRETNQVITLIKEGGHGVMDWFQK